MAKAPIEKEPLDKEMLVKPVLTGIGMRSLIFNTLDLPDSPLCYLCSLNISHNLMDHEDAIKKGLKTTNSPKVKRTPQERAERWRADLDRRKAKRKVKG
jgi:hypothetical protein